MRFAYLYLFFGALSSIAFGKKCDANRRRLGQCVLGEPVVEFTEICDVSSGSSGECIETSACRSVGGFPEAGHCPGDSDFQVLYSSAVRVGYLR